jgi:hypothetical protein
MVVATAAGWATLLLARHRPRWRAMRALAIAVLAAALLAPAWALRSPSGRTEVAEGVYLHRTASATVLVIDEARSPPMLLDGLRRAGVRRIDLVAAATEPRREVLDALRHRWAVGRVVAVDEVGPLRVRVGDLVVVAAPDTATTVVPAS